MGWWRLIFGEIAGIGQLSNRLGIKILQLLNLTGYPAVLLTLTLTLHTLAEIFRREGGALIVHNLHCLDMTKKEIVKTISEEIGLTQLKTKEIVQKTFDAIVETLVMDGRIELRNFGVFEVKRRAPRRARNPKTGDQVDVPAKYVVTFKPGKEMEARVRELEIREHQLGIQSLRSQQNNDSAAQSGDDLSDNR